MIHMGDIWSLLAKSHEIDKVDINWFYKISTSVSG